MNLYFPRTPRFVFRVFSKYTWRFSSKEKELFLTFDDGPTPEITTFVLTELKKYNAKATFFCIGKNIKNHPKIFTQIINDGHSVGNHTQNHLNGWSTSTNSYIKNVLECDMILNDCILQLKSNNTNSNTYKVSETLQDKTKIFRPPYGKIKKDQAKELLKKEYKIIMWDVLSGDFDTTISKEKCLQNVLHNATNGSIIVFHDSVKAAQKIEYTLPKVLDHFSKKGFVFKAIQ